MAIGVKRKYQPTVSYKAPMYKRPRMPVMNRGEIKQKNVLSSGALSTSGSVTLINGMASGSAQGEREALQIKLHELDLYFQVYATVDITYAFYRFYVIHDAAPNGSTPGFSTIFNTSDTLSAQNQSQKWRFKILWQKHIALGYNSTDGIGKSSASTHVKVPLGNRLTQYTGSGATISDIAKGALYFVQIGTSANYSSAYNCNLLYQDF